MPTNGCPGEETIETGHKVTWTRAPSPTALISVTTAPTQHALQGPRRLLAAAPASPPAGSPPGSSRGRAGGRRRAAVAVAAPRAGCRVKRPPSPDRAPLCVGRAIYGLTQVPRGSGTCWEKQNQMTRFHLPLLGSVFKALASPSLLRSLLLLILLLFLLLFQRAPFPVHSGEAGFLSSIK